MRGIYIYKQKKKVKTVYRFGFFFGHRKIEQRYDLDLLNCTSFNSRRNVVHHVFLFFFFFFLSTFFFLFRKIYFYLKKIHKDLSDILWDKV